jgi:hypothetical protein
VVEEQKEYTRIGAYNVGGRRRSSSQDALAPALPPSRALKSVVAWD